MFILTTILVIQEDFKYKACRLMNALCFSLCRVTKRRERTKKSALMSRKGKNSVGQPVVFWEMKNENQCFGEEKGLDDTSEGRCSDFTRRVEDDTGVTANSSFFYQKQVTKATIVLSSCFYVALYCFFPDRYQTVFSQIIGKI